jgi:hypothetical protein
MLGFFLVAEQPLDSKERFGSMDLVRGQLRKEIKFEENKRWKRGASKREGKYIDKGERTK